MIHKITILILLFFAIPFVAKAQDTLVFDVVTKHFSVGTLKLTRVKQDNTTRYKLYTQFHVFLATNVSYCLESEFKAGILQNSLAYIRVNDKYQHKCQVFKNGGKYTVNHLDEDATSLAAPIQSGIARLYFDAQITGDSIFSEFDGCYKPFVKKDKNTYRLADDKRPQDFVLENGHVVKVIVPNNIMDFYIVLKP
jgi:hypothetical protein